MGGIPRSTSPGAQCRHPEKEIDDVPEATPQPGDGLRRAQPTQTISGGGPVHVVGIGEEGDERRDGLPAAALG